MSNIRRIHNFQHSFTFSSQTQQFETFYARFLESDLGRIYLAVPWDGLVRSFGLGESKKGPRCIFSPKGKLALMFLKHYGCCSDRRLMEQLNGNLDWQFFCDIYLGADRLDNFKMISEIRCELAGKLDMDKVQRAFYGHWSPHMKDKDSITMDATCYESHLRYPTNVKLLWESVDWLHSLMRDTCKEMGETLPRSKYLKWKKRYVSYGKMRRKTKKKRRALTRSLLLLLDKLSGEVDRLEVRHKTTMTKGQYRRRATAKQVLAQQHAYFHKGKKPKDRIVSMDRPYIRPIIRGKETKPVEFGAKVNPSEWPWPGGQVPDRRDQHYRTFKFQRLPRGQPLPGYDLQGTAPYQDQNKIGRGGCHLCHQQEPEVRHQIRYQDRLQEKGQGGQARKTAEQACGRHHQGTGQQVGGQLRKGQGTLPSEKDKGTDQGHRDPMGILRHPHRQRTGDRQADVGHGTGKIGLRAIGPKNRWQRSVRTSKKTQKIPVKPTDNPLKE